MRCTVLAGLVCSVAGLTIDRLALSISAGPHLYGPTGVEPALSPRYAVHCPSELPSVPVQLPCSHYAVVHTVSHQRPPPLHATQAGRARPQQHNGRLKGQRRWECWWWDAQGWQLLPRPVALSAFRMQSTSYSSTAVGKRRADRCCSGGGLAGSRDTQAGSAVYLPSANAVVEVLKEADAQSKRTNGCC